MCRVFMCDKAALLELDRSVLESWFQALEDSLGGHGNGYAVLTESGTVVIEKGLNLTTSDAVDHMLSISNGTWYLFHTRLTSCMSTKDQFCHPFQMNDLTLIHNGHTQRWADWGKKYGWTDTQALTAYCGARDDLKEIREANGVYMGFNHGKPFVLKNAAYTDLILYQTETGHVFASEPDTSIQNDCFKVGRAQWESGDLVDIWTKMDIDTYVPRKKYTTTYGRGHGYYDQQYGWVDTDEWERDYNIRPSKKETKRLLRLVKVEEEKSSLSVVQLPVDYNEMTAEQRNAYWMARIAAQTVENNTVEAEATKM